MKILVMDGGRELGAFTFTDDIADAVLDGKLIEFKFGRFDGVYFSYGSIKEIIDGELA